MKKAFIALLFFTFLHSVTAQDETNNTQIALDFMEAYGNWDIDEMITYYSDSVVFEDPTASEVFPNTMKYIGKDQVGNFFKNVFQGVFEDDRPKYVEFKVESHFQTGSIVVVKSVFECLLPAAWFHGVEDEKVLVSVPFVNVLTFEDGKIIKHLDYGDYTLYNKQIAAQITK